MPVPNFFTRKNVVFLLLFVFIFGAGVLWGYLGFYGLTASPAPASNTIQDELESIVHSPNGDRLVLLQPRMREFISVLGMDSVMQTTRRGLDRNLYGINECHRILHLVGHFAYSVDDQDWSRLARKDANLCGHAYQHGIEAQISLSSGSPVSDLHKFCAALQNVQPGTTCYHGVGHEQMRTTSSVEKSLEACNMLRQDSPVDDLTDCYKGVFSEYAFQLSGVDGDTGTPFPGGPRIKLAFKTPMDFCQSQPVAYQYACASQLSRILLDAQEPDKALSGCIDKRYSQGLQSGCVQILSAVIAQQTFDNNKPLSASPVILKQLPQIRSAYMRGVAGEYWALKNSGVQKDILFFCESFFEQGDIVACKKQVGL